MWELVLSVSAFAVSASSLAFTYRAWQVSDRRARIPVLVFVMVPDRGWVLRNVGNGPALNITVARKSAAAGDWLEPTRVPPLGRDAEIALTWWRRPTELAVLGATYQDFAGADTARPGRTYTAICHESLSSVRPGRQLPAWSVGSSEASWRRERAGRRWGDDGAPRP